MLRKYPYWTFGICFMLTLSMTSSESFHGQLFRKQYALKTGILGSSIVSSAMQCLHKCKLTAGCQGMNIKNKGKFDSFVCQLTMTTASASTIQDWEQDDAWNFYNVATERKVYDVMALSYAMDDVASSVDPTANSKISINGVKISLSKGFNIVIFDFQMGISSRKVRRFYETETMQDMAKFLEKIAEGKILVVVVVDTGIESIGGLLPNDAKDALLGVGAEHVNVAYRTSYCLVTMVQRGGKKISWQQEMLKRNIEGPSNCRVVIY